MADMPNFDPTAALADTGDDFADDIAGETYPPRGRPLGQPISNQGRTLSGASQAGLVGAARSRLLGIADDGKTELLASLSNLVGLVREVAAQVEGLGIEPLAGYARRTSNVVDELHSSIAEKSVEDLLDDGRELVRRQPEIAVAAAMIIGFLGARLMKVRT